MKKIVGIIGAALLASSIFAVDFTAGVHFGGSLFSYNSDGNVIEALKVKHENQSYHLPIAFSVSGDKAGGALKLRDINSDTKNGIESDAWQVWFKPVDVLKITVGQFSTGLNQEHIGWCNSNAGIDSFGYTASLAVDAFSWDLFFAPGNDKSWFKKAGDADPEVQELYTKLQFGADFGTIMAEFDATNNFKSLRFGVGYNTKGLPVGLWFNFLGYVGENEFKKIRAEADVSTNFGSIGWELFLAGGYNVAKANIPDSGWKIGNCTFGEKPFLGYLTKFSIPVDAFGFYLKIEDQNVLNILQDGEKFNMVVTPGFTVNVGAANIDLGIKAEIQEKFAISVPVEFKISF